MSSFAKRRSLLLAGFAILLCSVFGGAFGPKARAAATAPEEELKESLRQFTTALRAVEDNYADPVSPDSTIYSGAIPGMLHKLDPHSNFFDPEQFSGLREEQQGRYAGVGMQVRSEEHTSELQSH